MLTAERLTVDNADHCLRNAELSRRQFREYSLVALTRRLRTHFHINIALCIHAHRGRIKRGHTRGTAFVIILRARTGMLDKTGHANTQILVVGPCLRLDTAPLVIVGQA